jgi:hypothetical protein
VHRLLAVLAMVFLSALLLGQTDVPQLEPLPKSSDGYMVGRHLRRLEFASRECGGSSDSTKAVLFFDAATHLRTDLSGFGLYQARRSQGFADEGKRLTPLLVTDEVCLRFYKLYGPHGISFRGAYDPTKIGRGNPAEPRAWWTAAGIKR